jgi:hypothetical protein
VHASGIPGDPVRRRAPELRTDTGRTSGAISRLAVSHHPHVKGIRR